MDEKNLSEMTQTRKLALQEKPPNFRDRDGRLRLVRCFICDPTNGKENYAPAVALGICAWCGWSKDR